MKDLTNKKTFLNVTNKMGVWLIILIIAFILSVSTDNFLTINNIINVLRQVCVTAIVGLGVSFVVLGGEIDLSTGMTATFAGCNAAIFITKYNLNVWLSILIALIIGAIIGLAIGFVITYLKIPSFIATLGMQYIIQGLILLTTKSIPITGLPDSFVYLGRGYIFNTIPVPVLIMIVFFILGAFILKYTVFGRSVLSIGESSEVSRLSGLNVKKTKLLMFVICSICASIAGIIMTARLSSGQPSSGQDLSLEALAAVYIGGTFSGSMLNTLAGALAWGVINNGLNLLGVDAYWQKISLGLVIILAVLLDTLRTHTLIAESK